MSSGDAAVSGTQPAPGAMYRLRAAAFFLLLVVSLMLFVPVLLLFWVAPLPARFRFSVHWCRFFVASLRFVCGIDHRIEGMENLPQGPVIYFSKHQSSWETLAFQTVFPHYVWILKREALRIPVFGWGLASLEPIAIDRSAGHDAVSQVKEQGIARLRAGLSILIFPQGTRVAPGEYRRYKLGGGILAVASGAPVVPIAHNAGCYWPAKRLLVARPGTIRVRIGRPLDPRGLSPEEITASLERWIEANTKELEGLAETPIKGVG